MTAIPASGIRVEERIGRDVAALLAVFLAGRLISLAVAQAALLVHPEWEVTGLVDMICRWDCKWYAGVAEIGYEPQARHWARGDGANWAFFPLLPLLMAGVSAATGLSLKVAGLVVANAAFVVAVIGFFLYARDLVDRRFALFAAALLALWPYSVHATVPMSEAVYLPASVLLFLFARREQWIAAGLAAAALSSTRAVGVFGFLPLFVLAVQRHGLLSLIRLAPQAAPASLACALAGLGIGLTMMVQWHVTGDALAFSHIQTAWSREFLWPWRMVVDELSPWRWDASAQIRHGLQLATALAGALLSIVLIRRKLWAEAVFVLATLGIAMTAGAAMSLARFTGALFPVVLAMALLLDRPGWRLPTLAVSALLLAGMSYLWVAIYSYAM